jgi:cytochrome b
VKVWDPFVRVAHWTLVSCVIVAWFTRESVHEALGYAALAVIAWRIVWGFAGSRYARFSQFIRSPSETFVYARAVTAGREPRYLGHNPLGGWMILALLIAVAVTALSGWLSVTERYWGVAWVQELHAASANVLATLAFLHVGGVVYTSIHPRENLARAMVTGRTAPPRPGDV